MATITEIRLIDDIDGTKADETIEFSLDGKTYEIDLSEDHASELRDALAAFVAAGRMITTRKASTGSKGSSGLPLAEIREWAREHGYQVSDRGRIKGEIIAAWQARPSGSSVTPDETVGEWQDETPEETPQDAQEAPTEEPEGQDTEEPQDELSEEDREVIAWHESKGYKVSLKKDGRPNGLMVTRFKRARNVA